MKHIEILFCDKWFCVVNKPAGMLSVPYAGSTAKTVLEELTHMRRKAGLVSYRSHPTAVHRLDRETSGILLFALNEETKKRTMSNWQHMVSERLYRAVCEVPNHTKPITQSGTINAPLAFNAHNIAYVPKQKQPHTVQAVTHYRILSANNDFALFELALETGKKNQIRAHLSYLGYTIAGDFEYRARTNPFLRLALHARTLSFTHPYTGEKMKFEVEEPKNWLQKCEKQPKIQIPLEKYD